MRAVSVVLLLAAACAPTARHEPIRPGGDAASCNAAAFAHLVGKPEAAIPMSTLPRPHRIVCADCVTTMEYSAQRLTIRLDEAGRVQSVGCG